MPELPEVESIRRDLADVVDGAVVVRADPGRGARYADAELIAGAKLGAPGRLGKYLVVPLEQHGTDLELVIHLGMSGQVHVVAPDAEPGPHLRARWHVEPDRGPAKIVEVRDARGFGRITLVAPGAYGGLGVLGRLGPDPTGADFTGRTLAVRLRGRRGPIKSVLLDQTVVAGIGNIYADEALWLARIHPRTPAGSLGAVRVGRLADGLREALAGGLARGGTTLRDYRRPDGTAGDNQGHLHAYGRAGEPCERCGEPLRRIVLSGRSSTFCIRCQRRR